MFSCISDIIVISKIFSRWGIFEIQPSQTWYNQIQNLQLSRKSLFVAIRNQCPNNFANIKKRGLVLFDRYSIYVFIFCTDGGRSVFHDQNRILVVSHCPGLTQQSPSCALVSTGRWRLHLGDADLYMNLWVNASKIYLELSKTFDKTSKCNFAIGKICLLSKTSYTSIELVKW